MRPLEILIPCILAIYLLWPLITGKSRSGLANYLPLAALLATILHLILEKYRWEMVPIYIIVAVCSVTAILGLKQARQDRFKRFSLRGIGLVTSLLVLLAATALPILLPVPTVPAPTGKYQVGTTTLVLVDDSRKEIYSSNPNDPRKFIVQIWYPARVTTASIRAPWMPDAQIVAPAMADYLGLPHFFLDQLALVKTSSYLNAAPDGSGGPYPVLLFSHGWNGFRAQNTDQIQELVSHGYVVASIEYTYADRVSVFPDGTVIPNDPNILPKGAPNDIYTAAAQLLLDQWTGDLAYTLDQLTALNANDPAGLFTGLLDLNRVGAFGHSTGGAATIQFCTEDPRCTAGFAMDAWMTPVSDQVLDNGTDRPMLFLFSETFPTQTNWQLFDRFAANLSGPVTVATIKGTSHYDFSDLPFLTPLAAKMGLKGPLNGKRVSQIINTFSLAFFDLELKGVQTTILAGPSSDYPELVFRTLSR
jgi:predicted dienelactone hydrolase